MVCVKVYHYDHAFVQRGIKNISMLLDRIVDDEACKSDCTILVSTPISIVICFSIEWSQYHERIPGFRSTNCHRSNISLQEPGIFKEKAPALTFNIELQPGPLLHVHAFLEDRSNP